MTSVIRKCPKAKKWQIFNYFGQITEMSQRTKQQQGRVSTSQSNGWVFDPRPQSESLGKEGSHQPPARGNFCRHQNQKVPCGFFFAWKAQETQPRSNCKYEC